MAIQEIAATVLLFFDLLSSTLVKAGVWFLGALASLFDIARWICITE